MSKSFLPLVAILSITIIEIVALQNGIDGTVLAASIATIAGVTGYTIKSKIIK